MGDRAGALNSGVRHLEKFSHYVDSLLSPEVETPQEVELGYEYPSVGDGEKVSHWERQLYRGLYERGLRPRVQYPQEQYLLDFALFAGDQRKLDIEVDGEQYHRSWDGELLRRDQIRNQRMIELGWDVMRFWVYQLRDDFAGCLNRVEQWEARPSH